MDSLFIQKLRKIVLANLSNEKFGVEDLAEEAGMSRANLYRRLRSIRHQDISHFIREIRLQQAMELLQQNQYTASEIAFKVGFGSPAYFNKCFHDYYGFPPGEVKRKMAERKMLDEILVDEESNSSEFTGMEEPENQKNHKNILKKDKRSGLFIGNMIGVVATVLIILTAAGYLLFNYWLPEKSKGVNPAEKSIAVLPFRNESPDQENDYLCSGITTEIYTHLQKIQGLRVKSRIVTEQQWDPVKDPRTFARKLGVEHILDGSVRKEGEKIRVSIQLIEAETGDQLWADAYDGIYNDKLLAFQSNIAHEIASSLNVVLTPEEITSIRQSSTTQIQAWDLVVRAMSMVSRSQSTGDQKYMESAHELLNQAMVIDPDYAKVYSGKGHAFAMALDYDSALYYADRTIELNPGDWRGYGLKGNIYAMMAGTDSLTDLAIKYTSKAVEMAPEESWLVMNLGLIYCWLKNNVGEGLPLITEGFLLSDNDDVQIYHLIGRTFLHMGMYEKAAKYLRKTISMGSGATGTWLYTRTLILQGKPEMAKSLLDSICTLQGCESCCDIVGLRTYVILVEYEEAEKAYERFTRRGDKLYYADSVNLALMYRELGRKEEAYQTLSHLRHSVESRLARRETGSEYFLLAHIAAIRNDKAMMIKNLDKTIQMGITLGWEDLFEIHPAFKNFLEDPDFQALVRKAKDIKAAMRAQVREMEARGELAL